MKSPEFDLPLPKETEILECPIFDLDGDETPSNIEVTYYMRGSLYVITEVDYNDCHPDDAHMTIRNKFKNVTFEL